MNNNLKCRNSSLKEYAGMIKDKKVIGFGISNLLHQLMEQQDEYSELIRSRLVGIADNDVSKQGEFYKETRIPIISAREILQYKDVVILITVASYQNIIAIYQQLNNMQFENEVECYSLFLLTKWPKINNDNTAMEQLLIQTEMLRIPKVIHSFWFSGEEKPERYVKCMESWKQKCPDYELIEWNSDNYDVTKNEYMYQAYQKGKWAFVSDYARIDVIYHLGGIYLDMDVEVLKSLDPLLAVNNFFCKDYRNYVDLGSGFGAVENSIYIKTLLDCYQDKIFIMEDGSMDMTPQPEALVKKFHEMGMGDNGNSEYICDNILFISKDYFKIPIGDETKQSWSGKEMAVHWHKGGWVSEDRLKARADNDNVLADIFNIFN